MDEVYNRTKEALEKVMQALKNDLNGVSTGRANPNLLNLVKVECYGGFSPLNQVANISVIDSATISVQPWDKSMLNPINRAIEMANLGVSSKVDGIIVRVITPKLSEERRKELVKLTKRYGEDKKVSVRNNRRDALEEIKKHKSDYSEDSVKKFGEKIQTLVDDYIKIIDNLVAEKEKDILKV